LKLQSSRPHALDADVLFAFIEEQEKLNDADTGLGWSGHSSSVETTGLLTGVFPEQNKSRASFVTAVGTDRAT